jgi:hypothetical protein
MAPRVCNCAGRLAQTQRLSGAARVKSASPHHQRPPPEQCLGCLAGCCPIGPPPARPQAWDCPPTRDTSEMDETAPDPRRRRPANKLPPWVFEHQVWVDRSAVEHEIESMPLHNVQAVIGFCHHQAHRMVTVAVWNSSSIRPDRVQVFVTAVEPFRAWWIVALMM